MSRSPIGWGIRQSMSETACGTRPLRGGHDIAHGAPYPDGVHAVRRPDAGHASVGEVRSEERIHRLLMRAAAQLSGVLRSLPGRDGKHVRACAPRNGADEALHLRHLLQHALRVTADSLRVLFGTDSKRGNAERTGP